MKPDKWSEWREENKEIIPKAVEWANSPTNFAPTLGCDLIGNQIEYGYLPLDDLRIFFGEGYVTKRVLKNLLIKRGVSRDVFTF